MLCVLLERGDTVALPTYLAGLRDSTDVDALYVLDADGRVTGQAVRMLPPPETLLAGREPPFTDYLALDDPSGLTIVAAAYLEPSPGCDPRAASVVIVRALDGHFMQKLEEQTGLAQSLIVGGARVATSLDAAPSWPLDRDTSEQVARSATACCTRGATEQETYYVGLAPLTDDQGRVVARQAHHGADLLRVHAARGRSGELPDFDAIALVRPRFCLPARQILPGRARRIILATR